MDIWFSQMDTENVKTSVRVDKQLYSVQSDYQRIDVFQSQEFGKMIVLDGEIIFSEADEFIYNEMIVHVPMAVHPHVKNVLIIGGGDGGVARICTQYPEIESIDVVEQDEIFVGSAGNFSRKQQRALMMRALRLRIWTGCAFCGDALENMILSSMIPRIPLDMRRDFLQENFTGAVIAP